MAAPDDFAQWIEPHQDTIARIVARLARPADRDDAYQRAVVAAWQHRDQFDESRGTLRGWLAAIATNEARRTWRGRVDAELPPEVPAVHVETTQVERDVDLERCLRRLPTDQRVAIHLHYFVDLSVADCAVAMDCSEARVKDLLYRGRRRMALLWGDR